MRSQSHLTIAAFYSTSFDAIHSETAAFFLISSLIRFYYEHLKVMFKKWLYCHITWTPVCRPV